MLEYKTKLRIIVKDYDPVTNLVILHDRHRELSDIVIPLKSIQDWRYNTDSDRRIRLQFFMRYIKKQGGKQTVFDMIDRLKEHGYYETDYGRK